MRKTLQKLFFIVAVFSIPLGFFVEHEPGSFWWNRIPSFDAFVGGIGAFLLLGAKTLVSLIASKKEELHD